MKAFINSLIILCGLALCSCSKKPITAAEAIKHIGENVTVCGTVYQVNNVETGTSFLNIGGDYPNQPFTAVCFKGHVPYDSLKNFEGLTVAVSGTIRDYRGKPEITITSLNQISTRRGTK